MIGIIIFKQTFSNQQRAGTMTKQRRPKIQATADEKQNQGSRKTHLEVPAQRKHIFKRKKKAKQSDTSVSNIKYQTISTTSPQHHSKNPNQSHLSSQLRDLKNPPFNPLSSIELQTIESDSKDYIFCQFNSQIFRKFHRSEQLGLIWTYLSSIGEHLYQQQSKFPMPILHYVNTSSFDQNERIRCIKLISSFCLRFKFKADTIFMALGIFHRIAFDKEFETYSNSLKAIISIFIAAKYEEIAIPKIQHFAAIDPQQIILTENLVQLESHVLIYFKFCLSFPSPLQFIELLAIRYAIDQSLKNKMIQLCYCSLSNLSLWQGRGSLLALACFSSILPEIEVVLQRNDYLTGELGWRMEQLAKLSIMP